MKKLFLMTLVCTLAFICSGCVKTTCNIEINKNDEIKITQQEGIVIKKNLPRSIVNAMQKDFEEIAKKHTSNSNLKTYVNDYSMGFIDEKTKLNFKDASKSLPAGFSSNENAFLVKNSLLKKTYTINLTYNPDEAVSAISKNYSDFKSTTGNLEKYGKLFVMSGIDEVISSNTMSNDIFIKIPKKAKKHNATTVISDTEYRWDMSGKNEPVQISLEYVKYRFLPW